MTLANPAAAVERVQAALRRRPEAGLHDDAPATARWQGGTRVVASHGNGKQVATDLPAALGGSDDELPPGWLLRAGLASCAAASVALAAAAAGIEPSRLEVEARSRSDSRGLFGMAGADGEPVYPGPGDVQLLVRIAAAGVAPATLRALVEGALRCSPVSSALSQATPQALHIEVETA